MTHKKNPSDQTNDIEISYKYNDSGIRTQKTVNGVTTNYHLVGGKVTFEENETDRIYYSYDNSDHLISMNLSTKNDNGTWTNGEEYFYIRNAQGDIIGLCDKSGVEVVRYSYDSFGKLTSSKTELDDENDDDKNGITGTLASTVGIKNPYRYRGYRFDSETGLYYLQSRYYNPGWGRFINADAIIGSAGELLGHNVFAYCKNNFVNGKDPSGFIPIYTQDEPTDEMVEAGYKAMNTAAKNRSSNSSITKSNNNKHKHNTYETYSIDGDIASVSGSIGVTGLEGSTEAHTPYFGPSGKYASIRGQGYIGGSFQLGLSVVDDGEWITESIGASLTPMKAGLRGSGHLWIFNAEVQVGANAGIGAGISFGAPKSGSRKLGISVSGLYTNLLGSEANIKLWIDTSN